MAIPGQPPHSEPQGCVL